MARVTLGFRDLDDGMLPDVCIQCGAPATTRKGKQFSWHHPAVFFTLLAGLLIYIIVALILTKRRWLSAPFCERHKNHWLWRTAVALGSFVLVAAFGAAALMVLTSADQRGSDELGGWLCLGSVALLFGWLVVVAVIQLGAIRAVEITDRSITLTNVAPEFLVAYEQETERDDYRSRIDDAVRDHWRGSKGRPPRDVDENIRRPGRVDPPTDAYEAE